MGYTGALIAVLVIALMSWRLAVGPKEARVRGALLLGLLMMIFLINTYGKLKQPYVGAGIYTTLIFLFAWLLGEFYAVYHKRGFWVGWVLFIFAWTAVYLREWPLDSYRTFLISEHDRKVVASKVGLLGKPGAEFVQQAMVNYAKPPTDALIEELSHMRPCPPNILFVEPGPIPPPAISMWMLRRQIRPQFDCSYNVTNLEEFEAYKKRNDLIVVPTVDAPGFNRFQLVSFLLPKIIENLQNDRNFRLLRTAPVTGTKGAVYFFQKI